jgi:hypothetical protein
MAYISLGVCTFADGTVRGSSRFLVEFPLERYDIKYPQGNLEEILQKTLPVVRHSALPSVRH